jgi:hypothetical protein
MPKKLILLIGLVALMMVLATSLVLAQAGGVFDLTWSTIDGGGGSSSGGGYALNGTIGQADAGSLSGGNFTLNGGFWPNGTVMTGASYMVYLPSIVK